MRIAATLAAASLSLLSQVPQTSMFDGDPKSILVACSEKARSLKPHRGEVMAASGRAFLVQGDRAKAEAAFNSALLDNWSECESSRLILGSWLTWGFRTEGLNFLTEIRTRYPRSADKRGWRTALVQSAVLLIDNHCPKEAEEIMELSYDMDHREWENMLVFARACLRNSKPEMAARWFHRAVSFKPKHEGIWTDIAVALAERGLDRGIDE